MADSPQKPPRRRRYAGTHPRKFHERYKELDPARFPEVQQKVRSQGRTPAGTHVPIMLREVLAALSPQPGDVALDCTVGFGGHAAALARAVSPGGRVIGIDLDQHESALAQQRLRSQGHSISVHHTNFAGAGNVLTAEGLSGVDCLLADLGVSSMQLDRPERGFGFKHDGPLDMRMDSTRGLTAAEVLAQTDAETLAGWLRDYGDEPDPERTAEAILREKPASTHDLAHCVLRAHGIEPRNFRRRSAREKHPAARVFQALRMVVNREAANLDHLLRTLPWLLNPGARAVILTFHSGEERRVRAALDAGLREGLYSERDSQGKTPTAPEIRDNPRARSARLFLATRAGTKTAEA